jgi:hypothetical protein
MTDILLEAHVNLRSHITEDTKTIVLSGLVTALTAYLVVSSIVQYFRLRHIPGPAGAGISKWWLIRSITKGRSHLDYYKVCQKYGESTLRAYNVFHALRSPAALRSNRPGRSQRPDNL